jgi:hypothetical protein
MELEHQERAPEENIFRKNRAGLMEQRPDGTFVGINTSAQGERPSASMKAIVRGRELSLREAYDRYKGNKGLGRADMIGLQVEVIETLQDRIGAVDEAAVAALAKRIEALETVIGNALRPLPIDPGYLPEPKTHSKSVLDEEITRMQVWFDDNPDVRKLPDGWEWGWPQTVDYMRVVRFDAVNRAKATTLFVDYRARQFVNDKDEADKEMGQALRDLFARVVSYARASESGVEKRGPGRPAKVKTEARNG